MHKNGMFYSLICINNHVFACYQGGRNIPPPPPYASTRVHAGQKQISPRDGNSRLEIEREKGGEREIARERERKREREGEKKRVRGEGVLLAVPSRWK